MSQVMDANQWQPCFPPRLPPSVVVHSIDSLAVKRKYPDRVQPAFRLDDRPGHVVEDHDMRALGLERLGRDDEHAPGYFGHGELPRPLQAAQVALAQTRVDRE